MGGSGMTGRGRRRPQPAVLHRALALGALVAGVACARPDEPPQDLGGPAAAAPSDSAAAARTAAQRSGASSATPARPDPAMQAVLDAYARLASQTGAPVPPDRPPTLADAGRRVLAGQGKDTAGAALVPGVRAAERGVRGAVGTLPATMYTPAGAAPLPVIVYFHGGAPAHTDRRVADGGARGLAREAGAIVLSVDVRRGADAPWPARYDDALAAYRWALRSAAAVGGDPARVALAGEGAGATLAVATAIAARDAGLQRPMAVLAVYPIAQTDTTGAAYAKYADAAPLGRTGASALLRQVAGTPAGLADARLRLVDANLRDLPPVTIVNAEIDPLRDDGARLEQALRDAGSPVQRRLYPGVTHDFFGLAAVVPAARDAQRYAGERLAAALAR